MTKNPTSGNGSARGIVRAKETREKHSAVRHPTTATLCKDLMKELGLSARAMACKLGIHHSTFQAYLQGRHRPVPHIRRRLARLSGEANFDNLLDRQMKKRHGILYSTICAHRQQERTTALKQGPEQEMYAGLNAPEVRYAEAKLRTQKVDLERQRQRVAAQMEEQRLYHEDDLLAAGLAKAQLDHAQRVLSFFENRGAPSQITDIQRQEVARLQSMYNSFQLRVDTISNTALLFARLALSELDAKIKLREQVLAMLGNPGDV